jgi:hypothetical protein
MAKVSKVYAVGINAGNDRNGNPRRGWFLYDAQGGYQGFLDEGYNGSSYLKHRFPKAVQLTYSMPVSYATYASGMEAEIG